MERVTTGYSWESIVGFRAPVVVGRQVVCKQSVLASASVWRVPEVLHAALHLQRQSGFMWFPNNKQRRRRGVGTASDFSSALHIRCVRMSNGTLMCLVTLTDPPACSLQCLSVRSAV